MTVKDKKAITDGEAKELDDIEDNKKRHLNVVFIGHVGMSTEVALVLFYVEYKIHEVIMV